MGITGNGGEASISGSPNLAFRISSSLGGNVTVAPDGPLDLLQSTSDRAPYYQEKYERILKLPPSYMATKTRQVLAVHGTPEQLLVLNAAQPSYVWLASADGKFHKRYVLVGSEGSGKSVTRAADVFAKSGHVFVVMAVYGGQVRVYRYRQPQLGGLAPLYT